MTIRLVPINYLPGRLRLSLPMPTACRQRGMAAPGCQFASEHVVLTSE